MKLKKIIIAAILIVSLFLLYKNYESSDNELKNLAYYNMNLLLEASKKEPVNNKVSRANIDDLHLYK